MLFLPKILTWFFSKICSLAGDFSPTPSAPLSKIKLLTNCVSPLPCYGARVIPLCFGSQHFSWPFQLAPVSLPILGSDFLCHHAFLVNVARARVLDADSLDVLSAVTSPAVVLRLFHYQSVRNVTNH